MGERKNIMLAYPFEEKRLEKWNSELVIVQPKLDGERCRGLATINPTLLSSEEEIKNFSMPHIVKALQDIRVKLGYDIELDGELYLHDETFEEIHSAVSRTTNLHPLHHRIEYHVFDIINNASQVERLRDLMEIAKIFPPEIKLVPATVAENLTEVRTIFERFIKDGYEGIIVRHIDAPYIRRRSTFMMKFKPKKKDLYKVVGYVEGTGKYSGTIGALRCQGNDGTIFEVGSFSITDDKRNELWEMRGDLTNFLCKVGYQHLTGKSGVPKSGVYIELVEAPKGMREVNPLL